MDENIHKQLISKLSTKLGSIKPFISLVSIESGIEHKVILQNGFETITYNKNILSLVFSTEFFNHCNDYDFGIYVLNQLILSLTDSINAKNHYVVKEDIVKDTSKILHKYFGVEWHATYGSLLQYLDMVDSECNIDEWDMKIDGKKIHATDLTFPHSIIYGSEYPLIINTRNIEIVKNFPTNEHIELIIPYHYVDDYHIIKLITGENQRKVILRNKKLNKIKHQLKLK